MDDFLSLLRDNRNFGVGWGKSMDLTKEQVTGSLRNFKSRRDALLHDDASTFDHALQRFIEYCQTDALAQAILAPLLQRFNFDATKWWDQNISQTERDAKLNFPPNQEEELALRYEIISFLSSKPESVFSFGFHFRKHDEGIELFRTIIIRPFVEELGNHLSDAANLATPEERELQAVPLNRLPRANETRIFLSHKSVDKPVVYRYYNALKQLGFEPWLDEPDMPAGTNLERAIYKGFEESCAAVFFITQYFRDERYLATEVDYAVIQKRKKERKFAIITLRYSDAAPVPDLLTPFTYKTVANDLEGFTELIRALPIEMGPVRWKADVVRD